jgi:hypothetical protein
MFGVDCSEKGAMCCSYEFFLIDNWGWFIPILVGEFPGVSVPFTGLQVGSVKNEKILLRNFFGDLFGLICLPQLKSSRNLITPVPFVNTKDCLTNLIKVQ